MPGIEPWCSASVHGPAGQLGWRVFVSKEGACAFCGSVPALTEPHIQKHGQCGTGRKGHRRRRSLPRRCVWGVLAVVACGCREQRDGRRLAYRGSRGSWRRSTKRSGRSSRSRKQVPTSGNSRRSWLPSAPPPARTGEEEEEGVPSPFPPFGLSLLGGLNLTRAATR